MIKASELRIGNRLRPLRVLDPENTPLCGYKISAGHIGYSDEELNHDWGPIALTPDILDKCGIKEGQFGFYGIFDEYGCNSLGYCLLGYKDDTWQAGMSDGEYSFGREFKFLHELQNLHFALTGQELEVKL